MPGPTAQQRSDPAAVRRMVDSILEGAQRAQSEATAIATVYYPARAIYLKALLTHREYDREEWKKWV